MKTSAKIVCFTLFATAVGFTLPQTRRQVSAQEQAPEQADSDESTASTQPPAPATDVVYLKNGGMIRGTISELIPNDKVTLVTITGETRTFTMSEVVYAGPASQAPSPPSRLPEATPEQKPKPTQTVQPDRARPAVTVKDEPAEVEMEGTEPDITFYVKTGSSTGDFSGMVFGSGGGLLTGSITSDNFTRICTAPCRAGMVKGTYTLGLSQESGSVVAADENVRITGKTKLVGEYTDNSGVRIGGWVIGIGGGVAGAALALSVIAQDTELGETPNLTPVFIGMGVILVAGIAGYVMIQVEDSASIEATHY